MASTNPIHEPIEHPTVTEKVFTKYNSTQANTYNEFRRNYHQSVYDYILEHHKSTGGKLDTVLDIGCGPGTVTRTLAPHFQQAIGIDPSPALLEVAKNHPSSPQNTTYHSSTSSTFVPSPIAPGSISLLTVANAAHWFPSMPTFYNLASQALQPNGTLAIWCSGAIRAAADLPNAQKIQEAMDRWVGVEMEEWTNEGSRLVRGGYADLTMPWDGGEQGANEFEEDGFVRREWGLDEKFFAELPREERGVGLKMLEMALGTGSAVTRWREEHPDLAGTDQDPLTRLVAKTGELLREAGVKPGEERVRGTASGVVLLFKKKGE